MLWPCGGRSADHENRAADRDHHVRAQAGPMAVPLPLQADRAAKQRGRADAGKSSQKTGHSQEFHSSADPM